MARPPVGYRLRQARRDCGMTQAALAAHADISASYLNLIEHGKRDVAGALLRRLAEALELDVAELTGAEISRLVHDLTEISTDPLLRDLKVDPPGAQEIVGRRPEWGRAVVRLHRSYHHASNLAEALSDRLAHDSTLLEASHELLTRMTPVRSFAEILKEHPDLESEQRERFTALIAEESAKLGDIAKSLFERLSSFGVSSRPTTPAEEVDDFFIDRGNHFPTLEGAAANLLAQMRYADGPSEAMLYDWLATRHDVSIETGDASNALDLTARRGTFDSAERAIRLPLGLPAPTRRFQLARVVFSLEAATLAEELTEDARLTSDAARERALNALYSYGAAAMLLPYDRFLEAAERTRYDLDHLAARFSASQEQVCHRLVTLRRSGAEGIPFAFLRVDPAGNISKRFSLPGLRLPRYGGACPLWAIYRAFQAPAEIAIQRVRLPDAREFLLMARAVSKPSAAYGSPAETYSVMIACESIYAERLIYGSAPGMTVETGINCHLCPRPACPQRAFPQLGGAVQVQ
jgi:predicted transcriptional regulator/transcriptional regulator with XRE-family HTH domain